MLTRLVICGGMAVARLAELLYSRRNIDRSGPTAEGRWSRRTFPLIVALHTAVILGSLFSGRDRPNRLWLSLLLAAQPVRLWVLITLRERWNAHAAVPLEMQVETGGPYAYLRHPNYSVIAVELATLPLAFGLPRLALLATVANAALLYVRIREEEALLGRSPGYREHFAAKPRFIPFLI